MTSMLTKTLIDHEALTRALAESKRRDPVRARQLEDIEAQDGWQRAAEQAAYGLQCDRLKLKPWQAPPCHAAGEVDPKGRYGGMPDEVALLRRLLEGGFSRWEPDVIRALQRVEAEQERVAP
jgi:hypothetical protein